MVLLINLDKERTLIKNVVEWGCWELVENLKKVLKDGSEIVEYLNGSKDCYAEKNVSYFCLWVVLLILFLDLFCALFFCFGTKL